MKTSDIIFSGLGLFAVAYAIKKYNSSNKPLPIYVSRTNWAKIVADTNRNNPSVNPVGYRDPMSDEWPSFSGTFTGYLQANEPNITLGQALGWFKGLNINPIHNQQYMTDKFNNKPYYQGDILRAYISGILKEFGDVAVGEYISNEQLTPSI